MTADGNKLEKVVTDQTVTPNKITTTNYCDGFVYNSDTLLYMLTGEGRIRPDSASGLPAGGFTYDYFLRDHLGDVRSIITEQTNENTYAATMEPQNAQTEDQLFDNISSTTVLKPNGFDNDPNNKQVSQLDGSSGNDSQPRVGPAIVLKVMAGDTITIATQAWYQGTVQPPPSGASNLLNDLLNALTGGVITNSHGLYGTSDNNPNTVLSGDLGQFFTNDENSNYNTSAPKAYLNWVAFDDQMNMNNANSGVVQVPQIAAGAQAQALVAPEQIIQKNGYLYIYVSNESAQKVFFDNLVIHHNKGHLLEEDQYYPFGLKMAGISDKALPVVPNNYLYNGKELQQNEFSDGTSINWYDYGFRNYDPQLGRFIEQDPLTDELTTVSPYQYALNDPIANIDEDGLSPFNLLCPGTSGFTIFLMNLGDAFTHIAGSPVTRAVSITATMTKTAAVVSNVLAVEGEINNTFSAPEVGGVGNAGGMGTPGSDLEGANSENIGQNNGGPGHPFLLPIIPFKVMVTEGKWAAGVIGEFIDPIVQSAKTLFKGTKPNGSKASTFQRVNAGIDFVAQTATLGGKGESEEGLDEAGDEPRIMGDLDATSAGGEKAIVIGEGMERVKIAARALQEEGINTKWYQAWSKNFPEDRLMTEKEFNVAKARNAKWLDSKIDQGYKIYDIGIDPSRVTRSPFYELEKAILKERGYPVTKLP